MARRRRGSMIPRCGRGGGGQFKVNRSELQVDLRRSKDSIKFPLALMVLMFFGRKNGLLLALALLNNQRAGFQPMDVLENGIYYIHPHQFLSGTCWFSHEFREIRFSDHRDGEPNFSQDNSEITTCLRSKG